LERRTVGKPYGEPLWMLLGISSSAEFPGRTVAGDRHTAGVYRYLNAFARHARRAVDMAGNKSVGIGSDGIHGDMTLATTRRHYGKMTKMLKTGGSFGKYFPDRPPILIKSGSWMFEILEEKLHESFSTTNVAGLCGQNFTDYLHRSLPQV